VLLLLLLKINKNKVQFSLEPLAGTGADKCCA